MTTSKQIKAVDTNIIVRFLTGDNSSLADQAQKLFETAEHESLYIPDVILAETVYVLENVYKLKRSDIVTKLGALIAQPVFYLVDTQAINQSLLIYMNSKTSFVDCYLAALVKSKVCNKVYTFDKQLQLIDKRLVSPK